MNEASESKPDQTNAQFWEELCGASLARSIGITDHSLHSLELFDQAYLDIYPYLLKRVNLDRMAGRKVLEIGLGYGTLGQKIAEAKTDYIASDIAEGPVRMMRHRLCLQGLPGNCIRASALDLPLSSASMDFVVSIGCFHHTGNIQKALDETYRVLNPGGIAVIMVYNQFSYRQWLRWPWLTFRAWLRDIGLQKGQVTVSQEQRRAYDANSEGEGAPETVFLSIAQLRQMLRRYKRVEFVKENVGAPFKFLRKMLLRPLGHRVGLDIYIEAQK